MFHVADLFVVDVQVDIVSAKQDVAFACRLYVEFSFIGRRTLGVVLGRCRARAYAEEGGNEQERDQD